MVKIIIQKNLSKQVSMFSKKGKNAAQNNVEVLEINRKAIPSIIVSDLNIEGDLISEGAIEIGGKVNGNIKCAQVTIRKSAFINGDIEAENLIIHGNVKGKILARNVSVTSHAQIRGAVEYGFLNVESGADIDCKFKRKIFEDVTLLSDPAKEEQEEVKDSKIVSLNEITADSKAIKDGEIIAEEDDAPSFTIVEGALVDDIDIKPKKARKSKASKKTSKK